MPEPETLGTERISTARCSTVERDRVRMPNGREVTMDVVRHPQSVVLLPVPETSHIILIRQYRYPINRFLWELPAGSVDEGEEPEAAPRSASATRRSARCPRPIVRLASLFPTPGYCDEEMVFFRLSGLEHADRRRRTRTRMRTSSRRRSCCAKCGR